LKKLVFKTQQTMAMQREVNNQIKQMIAFINQEAREKAEEIRVNAERSARNETATFIHTEKLRLNKEYEQKTEDVTQQRTIQKTQILREGQLKKLRNKDELKGKLKEAATTALKGAVKTASYKEFLINSAVEAALLIDEKKVAFTGLKADQQLLRTGLAEISRRYKKACARPDYNGSNPDCDFSMVESKVLDDSKVGGVVASAMAGRIVVDNTLLARLDICMHDLLPQLAKMMFGGKSK